MSVTPSPPKVHYKMQGEYRAHFEQIYCQAPILTFDGIPVRFRKQHFEHCMFDSMRRNGVKDQFSRKRAERIDWIRETLVNPNSNPRQGWDTKNNCIDKSRRVSVVYERFVVIIRVWQKKDETLTAEFVTCFQADNDETIRSIRAKPRWTKEDCR